MNDIDVHFASRLRVLRKERGFSQSDLAQRLGKPQASLSRLESGRRSALLPELYTLAGVFQLTLAELLSLENARRQQDPLAPPDPVSEEEALRLLAAHGVRFLGKTVTASVLKPRLESAVLALLDHALKPRLFPALAALLRRHASQIDWPALIAAAAAARRQNRLGAAVAAALQKEGSPVLKAAEERLASWRLDRVEILGPAPRTPEGRQMLAQRTPAWLRAWHFIGAPDLSDAA